MVFCVCPTYSAWGSAWLLFCCPFYATRFWQQILRGRDLEPPSHPSGTPMESFFPWRMSRFLHQAFIKLTRSAYGWPMSLGGSSGKLASSKSSVATWLNFLLTSWGPSVPASDQNGVCSSHRHSARRRWSAALYTAFFPGTGLHSPG